MVIISFKLEKSKFFLNFKAMIAMFSGNRVMSLTVFGDSWRKLVPGILTARPMTDLCWTCQSNNHLI